MWGNPNQSHWAVPRSVVPCRWESRLSCGPNLQDATAPVGGGGQPPWGTGAGTRRGRAGGTGGGGGPPGRRNPWTRGGPKAGGPPNPDTRSSLRGRGG